MKKQHLICALLLLATVMNAQTKPAIDLLKDSALIKAIDNKKQVYEAPEQMPEFPGGHGELMKFISKNLKYPPTAMENNEQGLVVLKFVVGKEGEISDIEVVRSVSPALNAEAVRVIKMLPKWIPGVQDGKKVSVFYTLPINFKLQDSQPVSKKLVSEKQFILLDGVRLPVGYDLSTLKKEDYDIETRWPETEHIKEALVKKYGPDAQNGVVIFSKKQVKRNASSDSIKSTTDTKTPVKSTATDSVKPTANTKSPVVIETAPDVVPEYPGGMEALSRDIARYIRYPLDAQAERIQGTVFVRFVINEDGTIGEKQVIRSVSPSLDNEALRVVSKLKKWIPGRKDLGYVKVYYTLPFKFAL